MQAQLKAIECVSSLLSHECSLIEDEDKRGFLHSILPAVPTKVFFRVADIHVPDQRRSTCTHRPDVALLMLRKTTMVTLSSYRYPVTPIQMTCSKAV